MPELMCQYKTLRTGLVFLVLPMVLFLACGDNEEAAQQESAAAGSKQTVHVLQDQEPFKDWVRDRYGDVVFIHPPNHPQQEKFEEIARVFSALKKQTRAFFRLAPTDSTVIYFYTGVGQGMQITQQTTPFSDGFVIHFWFPSYYGPPMVKHLLPLWSKEDPTHKFLKDGLIALLDGTTNNYHQATLKFIDSGTYIPLRRLASDTAINVDMERYQSAEAASFVDYIVSSHGIDKLKELYESKGGFSAEVERIFMMPLGKLQERWIDFLQIYGGKVTSVKGSKIQTSPGADSGQ